MRRISAQLPDASPGTLQARLQSLYPSVLVRPRGLSSDDDIWYVYREGRWVDGRAGDWWSDESMPRMDVDRDGFIGAANEAAGEAFGIAPNRLVHRHFTDFAVPGTGADMLLMREIMLAVGEAGGTFRHIRADGEVRVAEYHSVANESGSTVTIRPIGPMDAATPPRPHIELETRPATDGLFATVVDGIVARMPDPTPEGLQLRLRRSYPYATVDGADGRWRVARDPRPAAAPVDWADPSLARTVALDTSLIVEANEAALRLLGQDLVGRHWQELALPSSLDQRLQMRDYYVANGGAESTFRLLGAGGELVDYDYRLAWEGDRFTTVMSPFELHDGHGRPLARVILNADGTIATANDAALALYGATLAELQASPPGAFSANAQSPEAQAALREAWESQGEPDLVGETTLRALDGVQRRVAFGITRLGDGRFLAILRALDEPAEEELKLFTAGQALARWRAAERRLEALEPESPEALSISREVDRFRAAYQQLFASARETTSGQQAPTGSAAES